MGISSGVGPGERIAVLHGVEKPLVTRGPNGDRFPSGPPTARGALIREPDGSVAEMPLEPTEFGFPAVQPLLDERLLVVATRTDARAGPNAVVFGRNGAVNARFMFGDGIEHVLVDDEEHAWVGYFDEGIFGNFGWGPPGGPAPIGGSGLVRFSLVDGSTAWSFQIADGADEMADCYALNVWSKGVWFYYYTPFDVARVIDAGRVQRWRTPVAGARGIAVDGERILLIGSYGRPWEATLCLFGADELVEGQRVSIRHVDGSVPKGQLFARGDTLYCVEGPRWFSARLGDATGESRTATTRRRAREAWRHIAHRHM